MAERILGPTGSRRRRRFLYVPMLLVACTALFLIGNAQAVHDLEFQLDGNARAEVCGTTPDGGPSGANACTIQTYDWNSIFNADRSVNTTLVKDTNTQGFTTAAFQRDFGLRVSAADNCSLTNTTSTTFCTADGTTFATGSKDIQNISGGGADQSGNWQCNRDNNVNSKIDIMNAYSAAYTASNGHKLLYFALEKNKDNGNNNAAFWFLQDGSVNCSSPGGAVNFTGNHRDGDVLVTSAFTSGGGVSSILVFRWSGGANGCIDSNPNAAPACDQLPIGSGGDCKTAPSTPPNPNDAICATTNSGTLATTGNITVPWLTVDATLGVGNTVVPPDFFEGAVDLTRVFEQAGGNAPSCFNTFIADTRSSQSPTATLFDFARGQLGQCRTVLTTQSSKTGSSTIGTGTVSSGTDTANLAVIGSQNWAGTLTWYLCGPLATIPATGPKCDRTKGLLVTSRDVNQSSSGSDFVSGTASITEVGDYCWTAHFEPNQASKDAGVSAADDTGANECFTITPVTPTLTTAAVAALELLSPKIHGGLADLNGDSSNADDGQAFYGDTDIIGGKLDCDDWKNQSPSQNAGTAGDGSITDADDCTLVGVDGTADGVTIEVVDGSFATIDGAAIANGTELPALFKFPAVTSTTVAAADFAWSTQYGRVDADGDGDATTGDDCSVNIVNTYDILGSVCQGFTIPQGNGLVDLNDDGKITPDDTCTTGCFLGHKVSSGFVVTGPVPFGTAIHDVALLSGVATRKATNGIDTNYPSIICDGDSGAPAGTNVCKLAGTGNGTAGGKITFTLRGPQTAPPPPCPGVTNVTGQTNPQDVAVTGNGTYGPVSFTPDTPGTYFWQAQYFRDTGPPVDTNNQNSALHNADCDVSGETVVVQQIPTEIATGPFTYPQDSATIRSSVAGDKLPAGGTVVFKLFDSLTNCQNGASVVTKGTGGLVYIETKTNVVPAGGQHEVSGINTNNTEFKIDSSNDGTTYYWRVTYATGDTAHTSRQSACTESTAVTQTDDSGPGTLFTP
ncbi:MAG TPA: hypothetical protein VFM13_06585 [Gaiellaceae bacterium]|nr:hypothetical protein [Gaiellaceae bacterium]